MTTESIYFLGSICKNYKRIFQEGEKISKRSVRACGVHWRRRKGYTETCATMDVTIVHYVVTYRKSSNPFIRDAFGTRRPKAFNLPHSATKQAWLLPVNRKKKDLVKEIFESKSQVLCKSFLMNRKNASDHLIRTIKMKSRTTLPIDFPVWKSDTTFDHHHCTVTFLKSIKVNDLTNFYFVKPL